MLDTIGTVLGMAERSNALASQLLDGATVTPEDHRELRKALTGYQVGVQKMRETLTTKRRELLRG